MSPVLLLLTGLAPAVAAEPVADLDYRGAVDQARFQIRKGYFEQAEQDLERASQHPDGAVDPEVWFLLAQVRFELADLPAARDAAHRALTFARDADQQAATASLTDLLDQSYGLVKVDGIQPGLSWHPRIEAAGPLFDPEQQAYVDRLVKRLRKDKPKLPLVVGLPVGTWDVNGETVEIATEDRANVALGLRKAGGSLAAASLAWLEVGTGIALWFGSDENLLPTPDTQVAITAPIGGPWALGAVVHWTPTAIATEDGKYQFDSRAITAGLRIGPLIDDGELFLLRPAIGWRSGSIAGVRLTCTTDGAEAVCGDMPADVVVYANGTTHIGFVEVAADYLDRRRTSGFGAGVKLILEHGLVSLPASSDTRGALDLKTTLADDFRAPGRTGLRALANLSIVF